MIWLIAACLQCLLLWGLWRFARNTILESTLPTEDLVFDDEANIPTVAMIVPAAGNNPAMQEAITSLLEQDYPKFIPLIVTATDEDPATNLANTLKDKFPNLKSVIAGKAQHCSQKNHNILQGLEHVKQDANIFVFCDSTHIAKPDFIRQLVAPIIRGEAGFCTGYHDVMALDDKYVTLAYQFSVLLMRLLQAFAVFTQPWGGAMAISKRIFDEHKIAEIWKENVVDDCSLASMLIERRLHVQLCTRAMLKTNAKEHNIQTWQAWMQRQVLFLKFCVSSQWYLLGFFCALLALPVLMSCFMIIGGFANFLDSDYAWYVILAVAHLATLSSILLGMRELLPRRTEPKPWLISIFLGIGMFAWVYCNTLRVWHIDWHGIRYHVTKNGKLIRMEEI